MDNIDKSNLLIEMKYKIEELYSIIDNMEKRLNMYNNIIITQETYIKYLQERINSGNKN